MHNFKQKGCVCDMAEKVVKTPGRNRKTPEQKAAAIDAKIAQLEKEKEEILRPVKYKEVMDKAVENGISPDEMLKRLGLK